jgi:hypothetical protein
MKALRIFIVCATSFLTVSCAHLSPRVEPSFIPDQNTIIAYGSFQFTDNVTSKDNTFFAYRMALRLLNEDTQKQLFIQFSKNDPISCTRIESGRYRIVGFVATDSTGRILGGMKFAPEEKFTTSFTAKPNSAIYLGDFTGYARFSTRLTVVTFETGITSFTNNYFETTKVFHERFPHLASMPVCSTLESPTKLE